MDAQYHGMILRLFGSSAVLGGTIGTGVGPGSVEIGVDGVTTGSGGTLAAAIAPAQATLSAVAKFRA